MSEAYQKLKEEANTFFRAKDFSSAISLYKKALFEVDQHGAEAAVLHSNLAACYLSLNQYDDCIKSSTASLELTPNNTKALYRRSLALENAKRYEEAIKDVRELLRLEPNNKEGKVALPRLVKIYQDAIAGSSIQGVTEKVLSTDSEEQDKGSLQLLALIRESDQAIEFVKTKGLEALHQLLTDKSRTLTPAVRNRLINTLGIISNQADHAIALINLFTLNFFFEILQDEKEDIDLKKVAVTLLARVSVAFQAKFEASRPKDYSGRKVAPDEATLQIQALRVAIMKAFADTVVADSTNPEVLKHALMGLGKLPWQPVDADIFHKSGYVSKFLKVAAEKFEEDFSLMSVVLARVYDAANQDNDVKTQNVPRSAEYIAENLKGEDLKTHIKAVTALLCILMADNEVGVPVLMQDMMSVLTNLTSFPKNSDPNDQRQLLLLTTEIFAYAADHEQFQKMHSLPMDELEELFKLVHTTDKPIQARVVSTLAKLASVSPEVRAYLMKDKGEKALVSALGLLTYEETPADKPREYGEARNVRQWAVETLSFLTRLPELKEKLVNEHESSLGLLLSFTGTPGTEKTLSESAAKAPKKLSFSDFAVVSILHNLTYNPHMGLAQSDIELQEQMDKLKKFAGEKVRGKPHPLDSKENVEKRCVKVVNYGATKALVYIAKDITRLTEGMCDVISHVFLNLSNFVANRGLIVKEGGIKVLLAVSEHTSMKGRVSAAHALAKIAITTNPHVAFKNGVEFSIAKLIFPLTKSETPLEQFEALMALTNLADLSEEVRTAICKDNNGNGLEWIEGLQLEEDTQIRRAACELLCNLLMCKYVWDIYYEDERAARRLKLWGIFIQSDDFGTQRACASALATLSRDPVILEKFEGPIDFVVFIDLLSSGNPELEFIGTFIVHQLIKKAKKSASDKLVELGVVPLLKHLQKSSDQRVTTSVAKSLAILKA